MRTARSVNFCLPKLTASSPQPQFMLLSDSAASVILLLSVYCSQSQQWITTFSAKVCFVGLNLIVADLIVALPPFLYQVDYEAGTLGPGELLAMMIPCVLVVVVGAAAIAVRRSKRVVVV